MWRRTSSHRHITLSPHHHIPRGATLIEVLIVVTIMGIAGAIVVPSLVRPGQLTIQAAARQVISDLVMAQNEAVGHAEERRIQFDVANESYRLTDASGATLPLPWMKQGYSVKFDDRYRYDGIEIEAADFGGNDYVAFDEMGGTETGGSVDITADGYRYRITVAPFTGRVEVAPVP